MTSQLWRSRPLYTVMSLFVTWHALAIAIAPAPGGSAAVQSLHALFDPYLNLLGLNNRWDFYAPEIDRGHQLRYVVEDAAGERHSFVPTDELNWYHPAYWWFRAWYDAILDSPSDYGDYAAAFFCQKHGSLNPVAVTLMKFEEKDFSQTDYLNGKRPMDPEFVAVTTLKRVKCKAQ